MRFLFVDRILQLSPGEYARGIKHVTKDDAYLCCDKEGKVSFIPSLIGETLGQLAAWSTMAANDFTLRPVAGIVASARLHRPAYVGETLLLESVIESLDEKAVQYNSVARVGADVVFTIEGALGPLLPMTDFIDKDLIRRQFEEINRPGDWPKHWSVTTPQGELNSKAKPQVTMSFDQILDLIPNQSLTAVKHISRAAPYFPDHFPYKPVLPLTVLLESKMHLATEFLARSSFSENYKVSELRKIKMSDFVYPGDVIFCQLKLKQQDEQQLILSFRSEVEGKRICVLELVMIKG